MAGIYDYIYYRDTKASDLTEEKQQDEIVQISNKLKSLENEIVEYGRGRIVLMSSGNVFIDGFEDDLAKKIHRLL
jgi:hypothetical protein